MRRAPLWSLLLPPVLGMAGGGARFNLSSALGSSMVLQRDTPAVVWGWAEPRDVVHVVVRADDTGVADPAVVDTVDDSGAFRVELASHGAGGPFTINITSVFSDYPIAAVYAADGSRLPTAPFIAQAASSNFE